MEAGSQVLGVEGDQTETDSSAENHQDEKIQDVNPTDPSRTEDSETTISENEKDKSSGLDSDVEDYHDDVVLYPGQRLRRPTNPDLPETVTVLHTETGGKVYLIGTAHFSHESQNDVKKVIEETQPDIVLVELCSSRIEILRLDEATLLEEARNINFTKVRAAIKQGGLLQGIMHILLLNMSAHLTKQLGMAPGGEFRMAFNEARKISGCRLHLGDRPIQITMKRAFASLSCWQRLRLAWYMISSKDPISAEDVEKCKQKDLLEEMLREMTGEFPHVSRVFVAERDLYLAYSLRQAAQPLVPQQPEHPWVPAVVVGVVGIGHVPGIVKNWDTVTSKDILEIMRIPPSSKLGTVFRWSFRAVVIGAISWGCYELFSRSFACLPSYRTS